MVETKALDGLFVQVDLNLTFAVAGKLRPGNARSGLQFTAYILCRVMQRLQAYLPIYLQAQYAARPPGQGKPRWVGSTRQCGNGVDCLLNILVGAHHINAVNQGGADIGAAFAGGGGQLVNALDIGNGSFHRE